MADFEYSDDEIRAALGGQQTPRVAPDEYSDEEVMAALGGQQTPISPMQRAGNAVEGLKSGLTFGFGDEIQAGIAGGYGALSPHLTFKEGYDQALQDFRGQYDTAKAQTPWTTGAGELVGAIGTGIGAAPRALTKGLANVSAKGLLPKLAINTGIGATSGGIYGFGTGEGGLGERAVNTGDMAILGGLGGIAGAGLGVGLEKIGRPLLSTRMAKAIMGKKNQAMKTQGMTPNKVAQEIAERQSIAAPVIGGEAAYDKVSKALREDLGDDYETALQSFKDGDISLIDLNGSRSRTLAQGGAQFPTGKAKAQEYFDPKTEGAYDRILKNIKQNVTSVDSYHTTADDLLSAGRTKAAPLYDEAYEAVLDIDEDALSLLTSPEVQSAIKSARKTYATELTGVAEDSIKLIDYAKKEMDDIIGSARTAGAPNKARYLTGIKNDMLDLVDDQVPVYAEARKVSGDYLSIDEAMENGRKALSEDSELVGINFKKLTDPEKAAYTVGLGKAIRDVAGDIGDGTNPYKRILGSPEKRQRISSILSPKQFKSMEAGLKAEDRLFTMRNEILGGSPTAGKQEAKNLISNTVGAIDDMSQVPRKAMTAGLRELVAGLDDKTAGKVSEILYETDPIKKLAILDKLKGAREFTPQQKTLIKETYFSAADKFDVMKATTVKAGGVTPAITERKE